MTTLVAERLPYTVTEAAGQLVAGRPHDGVGSTVELTSIEARYELLLGAIVPEGVPVVVPPPADPVMSIDRVLATRGSKDWDFTVADLVEFLIGPRLDDVRDDVRGGVEPDRDTLAKLSAAIDAAVERLQASIATRAARTNLDALRDALRDGVAPDRDTLAKLSAAIDASADELKDRIQAQITDGALVGKAASGVNRDITALAGVPGGGVTNAYGRVGLTLGGVASVDLVRLLATTALAPVVYVTGVVDLAGQAPALTDYWNQVLRGPGAIAGLYGKVVVPEVAPSDHMECGTDLIPEIHLRQFNSVTNPIVLHIGDSLSTAFANSLGHANTLTGLIEAHLRRQCLGRSLTFVNRAVGGMGWLTLDGVAARSYMPPWYTDPNKKLIDYYRDVAPDLIVVDLGMNVSPGGTIGPLRRLLAAIAAWPKIPDVVFATNLVPRPSAQVAAWGTRDDQEARHRTAGLVRTFAHSQGYGLLDFGRQQNLTQHAFDPLGGAYRRGAGGGAVQPIAGNRYLGTRETRHIGVRFGFDPSRLGLNQPQVISVQIGGGGNDVLQISKYGATENDFYLSWYVGASDAGGPGDIWRYAEESVKLYPDDGGLIWLRVEALNGMGSVYRETQYPIAPYGEFAVPIARRLCPMHGGLFRPEIAEVASGPCVVYAEYYYADDRLNAPGITGDVLWGNGVTLEGAPGDGPNGGSGYNHHSNWAATHIYGPVLAASRFVCALGAHGSTAGPDANWTIPTRHAHFAIPPLTASRQWELPAVTSYPHGQDLVVVDEGGSLGGAATLALVPRAGSGDTIPGYANGRIEMATRGAVVRLRRGRLSNAWISV